MFFFCRLVVVVVGRCLRCLFRIDDFIRHFYCSPLVGLSHFNENRLRSMFDTAQTYGTRTERRWANSFWRILFFCPLPRQRKSTIEYEFDAVRIRISEFENATFYIRRAVKVFSKPANEKLCSCDAVQFVFSAICSSLLLLKFGKMVFSFAWNGYASDGGSRQPDNNGVCDIFAHIFGGTCVPVTWSVVACTNV